MKTSSGPAPAGRFRAHSCFAKLYVLPGWFGANSPRMTWLHPAQARARVRPKVGTTADRNGLIGTVDGPPIKLRRNSLEKVAGDILSPGSYRLRHMRVLVLDNGEPSPGNLLDPLRELGAECEVRPS